MTDWVRPGTQGFQRYEARCGLLFVLPVVLLFLFVRVFPTLGAFYLSLTKFSGIGTPTWLGLENYIDLLGDDVFRKAIGNTLLYTFGTVVPATLLGLFFAILLNERIRGLPIFRVAFYSPVVVSFVSISMIWIYIMNSQFGVLNYLLSFFSIPKIRWLDDTTWALPSITFLGVWKNLGYTTIIYLASLQAIPPEFREAATVDGAGVWHQFRYITWPLLWPTTIFIVLMTGIFAFQAFDQILVLTAGGPGRATTTVVFEIYQNAFEFLKMGYASAMAFVLFGVIAFASVMLLRTQRVDQLS